VRRGRAALALLDNNLRWRRTAAPLEPVTLSALSRPAKQVTWFDATEHCAKLTERERAAGRIAPNSVYRLPTEAEWDYACRAWTSTRFSNGDDPGYTNLTNYAWHVNNSDGQTHPVGLL
jgi:formylglycine-generating enzyme required for sulfatase activity